MRSARFVGEKPWEAREMATKERRETFEQWPWAMASCHKQEKWAEASVDLEIGG